MRNTNFNPSKTSTNKFMDAGVLINSNFGFRISALSSLTSIFPFNFSPFFNRILLTINNLLLKTYRKFFFVSIL